MSGRCLNAGGGVVQVCPARCALCNDLCHPTRVVKDSLGQKNDSELNDAHE